MVKFRTLLVSSAWLGSLGTGGCTRTEEVLTRRAPLAPSSSTPPTADAGDLTSDVAPPTSTSSETSATTPGNDSTSTDPFTPPDEPGTPIVAAPPLVVGTGFETTCLAVNQDQVSLLGCFGALALEPRMYAAAPEKPPRFAALDGGEGHMCLLTDVGVVYCWGRNSSGQLGAGHRDSTNAIVQVEVPERVVSLSSGGSHVCAITMSGQLYCWGQNSEGQLGIGEGAPNGDDGGSSTGTAQLVEGGPWRSVSAGFTHTCAIREDGSMWCWGRNTQFQVGSTGEPQVRSPLRVNESSTWSAVAAGQSHSCALSVDETLWCWGSDATADSDYPLSADPDWQWPSPRQVGERRFKALATRSFHSCAISLDDELWCWGRNEEGQLGTGNRNNQPTAVRVLSTARQVSLGQFHTCVVTSETDARCTGSNEFGQLGTATDRGRDEFASFIDELQNLFLLDRHP